MTFGEFKNTEEYIEADVVSFVDTNGEENFKFKEDVDKFFDKFDAVLMANHGFIVGAKTIEDAYLKLELAESYAQVVLNTEILGGAKYLTKEQEKEILELRKKL